MKNHSLNLYYLISWKSYSEGENTWELVVAIQHLRKLFTTYHKKHLEKSTAMFKPINNASLIVRSLKALERSLEPVTIKKKWAQPIKASDINKHIRKIWTITIFLSLIPWFFLAKPCLTKMIFSYRFLNNFLLQITYLLCISSS